MCLRPPRFTRTATLVPYATLFRSAGSQRPALHEQLLISRNPHTPTRPSFAHCDCTAAGSTGLSLLTQAGIAPQQLPTFLTVQSLSALQPYSIVGASRTRLGGNGRDIDGGALAAGSCATAPPLVAEIGRAHV